MSKRFSTHHVHTDIKLVRHSQQKNLPCSLKNVPVAITSQLSLLCFSELHNVGLAGADTEAAFDRQSSFHESRRQSQLFGCSLSVGTDACWALSQDVPGSGLWNAWVQVITDGPCSSQKWHKEIIAFMSATYYSAKKHTWQYISHTRLFTTSCDMKNSKHDQL